MEVPSNETPESVQTIFDLVIGILSSYGWTILFILIILNLLYSHFEPRYRKWQDRVEDQKKEEEYRENPELVLSRQEGLARARQKLLEQHLQLEREHAEKMKEAEERKRQEKIDNYEKFLKKSKSDESKKTQSLRTEYNPLMGSGGPSCSYRPSRSRGGGGG